MTPVYRTSPVLDALPADEPAASEPLLEALPVRKPADPEPMLEALPVRRPAASPPLLVALPVDAPTACEAILEALPVLREPEPMRKRKRGVLGLAGWIVHIVGSTLEWLFGAAVLMVGLAVLAALPLLQFLSLGYLLEAGGRVARTGRLRNGFIGVRLAARLGGVVIGAWLLLLPTRFVAQLAHAAQVIDPGGPVARAWRVGLLLLIGATALHIGAACARGGRLRYFLWPFNVIWLLRRLLRGGYYTEARDAVWDVVGALRLPYYAWLGFRGFIGAGAWLLIPVTLLALGRLPAAPGLGFVLGFLGALMLGVVVLYLPLLQMHMAAENRLSAVFAVRAVRNEYRRAPWACTLAFVLTLLSALPLYLLKIEIVPREAAWLPGLAFIAFIFPARLLTGWALARARRRETPRHWFFRWTGRLPLLPAAAFYVLIVFFTRFTSWNGVWDLYEQHAFLLPVPFFGV